MGVSLIQEAGGTEFDECRWHFGEGALAVLRGLDRAAQFGVRDDFLLSPHYYPAWGWTPDLPSGSIGFDFNIFHPKASEVIRNWAALMAERMKDKPALHSVCLANEPAYNASGRNKYSRPMFTDFLKAKHHSVDRMNALYGTAYTNFDQVVVPALRHARQTGRLRAYYDWTCFNNKMFADWHAWLGSVLKAHGLKAPTHKKSVCSKRWMGQGGLGSRSGIDLSRHGLGRLRCLCPLWLAQRKPRLRLSWAGAFLRPAPFLSRPVRIQQRKPFEHRRRGPGARSDEPHRSVLWQGGLHHQGSTTIWVWEMSSDVSLAGNIYFRPANIYGAGRAMLDLNRLSPEVTAINNARPRVALLYSAPSIFWQEKYKGRQSSRSTPRSTSWASQ